MKVLTEHNPIGSGTIYCDAETGEWLGILCGSIGPYGESTGIFRQCKTTTPRIELGMTHVDGEILDSWLKPRREK